MGITQSPAAYGLLGFGMIRRGVLRMDEENGEWKADCGQGEVGVVK
jgi:hypothetical protein